MSHSWGAGVGGLSVLPGVVHKRGKGGCLNLLSVADVGRPLGLPGSVAQAGAAVISQAVRPAGKNRIKNTSIKHLQICIVRQILSRFFSTYPNIPHGTTSWHGVFLDSKCIAQLLAHDSLNMKKPHNPPAIGIGI